MAIRYFNGIIVKFPPASTMVPPDFYTDTVLKGNKRRICLFKTDKNKDIYVRSVYSMHASGFWKEIKRYDLKDKLVEIYFPLGTGEPKQSWSEVAVSNLDSVITDNWDYGNYVNRSRMIYSKKGALKEVWDISRWPERNDSSITRSVNYYNENGQLIAKNSVDQNNQLFTEERLYYKDNKLVKYTRDDNPNDSLFAEQKVYNNIGQTIFNSNYNSGNGQEFIYKHFYDNRNLLMRKEYYINEKLQDYLRYEYR